MRKADAAEAQVVAVDMIDAAGGGADKPYVDCRSSSACIHPGHRAHQQHVDTRQLFRAQCRAR